MEPSHDERYKWFAPFGFVRYADEHGRHVGHAGRAGARADVARGHRAEGVVVGPASQAIEVIREFEARYPGLDQVMLHWTEGLTVKEFKEQLQRFAREVIPAFRP